jgi:hypothetical protein
MVIRGNQTVLLGERSCDRLALEIVNEMMMMIVTSKSPSAVMSVTLAAPDREITLPSCSFQSIVIVKS